MPLRHVIVGGVGFVGVGLAAELSGTSEVVVAARPGSARRRPRIARELKRLGAHVALSERLDVDFLERLSGDVYYHVAGKLWGSMKELEEAHVNLLGRAVSAASKIGARVVYVSSIGVGAEMRGVPRHSTVAEEEKHLDPAIFVHRGPYEVTKAKAERLLVSRGSELHGRWSIVRPALIFGPWGYEVQWRFILGMARRGLAPYANSRNMIYIGDLTRVLAEAGSGKYDGKWVYASDPRDIDLGDVATEICRQEKRGCRRVNISWALKAIGLLPVSPMYVTYRMISGGYKFKSRFLEGFRFTDLGEAVSSFLQWARGGLSP
ncbi:MAG: NAD-dependent epimerase/dehydratase family protein [Acidilobus sp.]